MSRRWKLFFIVGLVSLIADQATKIWARAELPTDALGRGLPVSVVKNFFDWRLSHNPGSAFGLFGGTDGARIFLSIIGLFALGAIFWMLHKTKNHQTRLIWALGLVAGGAIGNLIDRIYYGVVTDFVVWRYYETEWPTFNVADVALVVGVGLLFLDMKNLPVDEPSAGKSSKASSKTAKGAKAGKRGGKAAAAAANNESPEA